MRAGGVVFLILLGVSLAVAQTKVSGTVQCGKPDHQQSMDVGDPRPSFLHHRAG
jgi:hypothetical protein